MKERSLFMYSVTKDSRIKLLIYLKVSQLCREEMSSLKYRHVVDYLRIYKWKKSLPFSFHEATNDIISITAEEIVAFLAKQNADRNRRLNQDSFGNMFE